MVEEVERERGGKEIRRRGGEAGGWFYRMICRRGGGRRKEDRDRLGEGAGIKKLIRVTSEKRGVGYERILAPAYRLT